MEQQPQWLQVKKLLKNRWKQPWKRKSDELFHVFYLSDLMKNCVDHCTDVIEKESAYFF